MFLQENLWKKSINKTLCFKKFNIFSYNKTKIILKKILWQWDWNRELRCSNLSYCGRSRLALSQFDFWYDRQRTPPQDEDLSGNDPHLVPGFLRQRSGMFPERFRRMSVPVGSRENCPVWTEHQRCGTLSCGIPGTVFQRLCPQSLQKLVLYTPQWFQEQMCFVTGFS